MDLTHILILGGLVYVAMQQKKEATRNIILVVAGLLFFCMMGKEGFDSVTWTGGDVDGSTLPEDARGLSGQEGTGADGTGAFGAPAHSAHIKKADGTIWKFSGDWVLADGTHGNPQCSQPGETAWKPAPISATADAAAGGAVLLATSVNDFYPCAAAATACPDTKPGDITCTGTTVYMPGKALGAGQVASATTCCEEDDRALCSAGLADDQIAADLKEQGELCPELGSSYVGTNRCPADNCVTGDYGYLGACCSDPTGTPKPMEPWSPASSNGLCRTGAATEDTALACTDVGIRGDGAWGGQNCHDSIKTDNCVSKTRGTFS
jgi:hypothetical protein